jgi:hypothetical protein
MRVHTRVRFTDPATIVAAASATDSLAAFADALHHGAPLRSSPAFTALLAQIDPQRTVRSR